MPERCAAQVVIGTAGPSRPRIYIFIAERLPEGDVVGKALAEDGTVLGQHISSDVYWFRRDMGLTDPRNYHHIDYAHRYPDGYELVEAEPPEEVLEAWRRRRPPRAGATI